MKTRCFIVVSLLFSLCDLVLSNCINIKQCPSALKYLNDFQNNEIHNSSLEILRNAYCTTTGTETKVFCEKIPLCYEPSDENFCVRAKECCVFKRLVDQNLIQNAEVIRKVREAACDPINGESRVKCTSLLKLEGKFFGQTLNENDVCVTPSGLKGRCVPWQTCPTFKDKPVNQNFLHFLERSICNVKDRKCCCSSEENIGHVCGIDNTTSEKISGGTATAINEFPWVVLLKYTDPKFLCGGSLINSQFVLTAAHCIRRDLTKVRIAGNFRDKILEHAIVSTKIHPGYTPRPLQYDIALIKIRPVSYSDSISWICLPRKTNTLPQKYVIVGNGFTEEDTLSKLQLKATLLSADISRCEKLHSRHLDGYYEFVICAGGELGVDACRGDSGGPLMSKGDSIEWRLYGIVSGGTIACSNGSRSPGFYTRVDKFLDWINVNMREMLEN